MYIGIYLFCVSVCMYACAPLLSPLVGSDDNLKELIASFYHVGLGHLILLFQGIRLGSPRFSLLSWLTSGLIHDIIYTQLSVRWLRKLLFHVIATVIYVVPYSSR